MAIDRTSPGDTEWVTTLTVSDADEEGICTVVAVDGATGWELGRKEITQAELRVLLCLVVGGSVPSGILATAKAEEERRIALGRTLETAPRLQ